MDPVTSMAEDEMELHSWPRPAPPLQGHNFCVTLGASLAGAVSALALATTQKLGARGSGDDLVVSSWTLDPDLCFLPACDKLPGTVLVCYQKLDGVCQADPSGLPSEISK